MNKTFSTASSIAQIVGHTTVGAQLLAQQFAVRKIGSETFNAGNTLQTNQPSVTFTSGFFNVPATATKQTTLTFSSVAVPTAG